jgi:hypothetical protein
MKVLEILKQISELESKKPCKINPIVYKRVNNSVFIITTSIISLHYCLKYLVSLLLKFSVRLE